MKLAKSDRWLFGTLLFFVVTVALCWIFQLRLNTSNSMPLGIYRVINKPLAIEDWAEICLPLVIAKVGLAHNYLMGGQCAGGAEPVIKQVVGMQGDVINLQSNGVWINGKLLVHSETLAHDTQGRALDAIARGHYRLQKNMLWVYGNHDIKSWDSRYFGAISTDNVRAVLKPVFTFN